MLIEKPANAQVSIFVVIVLYQMRPSESATFRSLQTALESVDRSDCSVTILIADNTPGGQQIDDLPSGIGYRAFPDNPGLVTPYNKAIAQAELEGSQWLLTLDQDTELPTGFLTAMTAHIRLFGADSAVAAIVPRIFDNGVPISPLRFVGGFLPVIVDGSVRGILGPHASALNSASLLRITAIKAAGGYDPQLPLNNSDTALFYRLDKAGFRIALADDVVVEHELAIMRRGDRMTSQRYRQLLLDERYFWDRYMGPLGRAERLMRLAVRLLKSFAANEDASFRRVTRGELLMRLFTRRSKRISEAISNDGNR